METFDRYAQFRNGNEIGIVKYGNVPEKDSDKFIVYEKGVTRLDQVSYQFYGSSNYAWLILQANAKYGSLEFRIPDGVTLRIPYPLNVSLTDYQKSIEKNKEYYS